MVKVKFMSTSKASRGPKSETPVSRFMTRFRDAKADVRERASGRDPESRANDVEGRWPLPGLAPMTRVETSFGKVHAVALRKGDPVKTRSGEFRKIVWLNRVLLDHSLLIEKPDANPVRIRTGALGPSVPERDILVSPRQKLCPGPKVSLERREEAGDLAGASGIARQPETGLSYTMFHLGEPAEVECDGVFMLFEPPRAIRDD